MPARSEPFSAAAPLVRYARLAFDGQHVLVPNSRIHSVEHTLDVAIDRDAAGGPDEIVIGGARWPVYALGQDLAPVPIAPHARSVCVLLDAPAGGLALLCDELRSLEEEAPRVVPVPPCMRVPGAPVESLCVVGDRVLSVLCIDALGAWLRVGRAEPSAIPDAEEGAGGGHC